MEAEAWKGYEPEALIRLVRGLAEKYTGLESSSVSYEKAQQLMEAVMYCIEEYEKHSALPEAGGSKNSKKSAGEAYRAGYELVIKKTREANALYQEIMEGFCDYGSIAYRDTMVHGMPQFFLRYDARFAPQDELLLLDYPVLQPLEHLHGIDKIYQYLCCIRTEQNFLKGFPEEYVRETCRNYHPDYEELFCSLTEMMLA